MMDRLYLGVDQGSSATKALLIDGLGQHFFERSISVSTRREANKVEQNPIELLNSCRDLIDEAIRVSQKHKKQLAAIGLSFQRSGVCAWEAQSGAAVSALITYRDTRMQQAVDSLQESYELISKKSGLPVLPNYAAPKIAHLQAEFPDKAYLVGTLDTYIMQQLSGDSRFMTEDSMAARTMLYSLEQGTWDQELCQLFKVQQDRLPLVAPSIGQHGTYRGIPIAAMMGDQQASLYARVAEGSDVVLNFGTVASISVSTGSQVEKLPGFISSVLWTENWNQRSYRYLLEGIKREFSPVLDLIRRECNTGHATVDFDRLCNDSQTSTAVAFLPNGFIETPYWKACHNLIINWQTADKPAFAKAALSGLGCFICESIGLLKDAGLIKPSVSSILVTGGPSKINFLLQFIADVSGFEIYRISTSEGSAKGIAIAAMQRWGKETAGIHLPQDPVIDRFSPKKSSNCEYYLKWTALRDAALVGQVPEGAVIYE